MELLLKSQFTIVKELGATISLADTNIAPPPSAVPVIEPFWIVIASSVEDAPAIMPPSIWKLKILPELEEPSIIVLPVPFPVIVTSSVTNISPEVRFTVKFPLNVITSAPAFALAWATASRKEPGPASSPFVTIWPKDRPATNNKENVRNKFRVVFCFIMKCWFS